MEPQDFDRQPGRRMQVGGALALGIGILLLIFLPAPAPGSPVDVHRVSYAFIAVGVLGLVAGTIGRKLLL
jgi:hypothetical protein